MGKCNIIKKCMTGIALSAMLITATATVYAADDQVPELGYIDGGYTEESDHIGSINGSDPFVNVFGSLYPAQYDSRNVSGKNYVTPVKNQGYFGTCWSFAAMACAESYALKNGLTAGIPDFSEYHLAHFAYNIGTDPIGGLKGDKYYYSGNHLDFGGNSTLATFTLAAWRGVVDESVLPYTSAGIITPSSSLEYQSNLRMTNSNMIAMTDRDAVKKHIMNNGAVVSDYYETDYYHADNGAYYESVYNEANHAITIVGWDDNYDKKNFNSSMRPSSNGAWLVKNSWGTDRYDEGYFWMSYGTSSLKNSMAVAYEYEAADKNKNNYQYDGCGGGYYYTLGQGDYISNVFTAKSQENLEAVSIAAASTNLKYKIQVYKNLTNPKDPRSGTAMLSTPQTGAFTYAGYHTVDLKEIIYLNKGDTFSIVIQVETTDGNAPKMYIDYLAQIGGATADPAETIGQSFYMYNAKYYNLWYDASKELSGVTNRIKAFTTNSTEKVNIANTTISAIANQTYNGSKLKPRLTVKYKKQSLVSGSDYTVAYMDNTSAGTATVTITGKGRYIGSINKTFKIVQSKPTLTAKSYSYKGIKLTWKATGGDVYIVERSTKATSGFKAIKTINSASARSYSDTSVTTNKNYYYRIRSHKVINGTKVYSSYSPIQLAKAIPATPKISSALSKGYSSTQIKWAKVAGAKGYYVYRSTTPAKGYKLIKTIKNGSTVTYNNKNLTSGTVYYYKVIAYTTVSGKTVASIASGKKGVKPIPAQVVISSVKKKTSTSAALKWKKVSGTTKYQIYRSTSEKGKYKKVATVSGSTTSYINSGLTKGKKYYYKIRAYRSVYGKLIYGKYSKIRKLSL